MTHMNVNVMTGFKTIVPFKHAGIYAYINKKIMRGRGEGGVGGGGGGRGELKTEVTAS